MQTVFDVLILRFSALISGTFCTGIGVQKNSIAGCLEGKEFVIIKTIPSDDKDNLGMQY
jgi:hypothetical protein